MKIQATIKDQYTTTIEARGHHIIADEPASLEGQDKGMTPTELLGASLASCTCITMRMYAKRKGLEADINVMVDVHLDIKTTKATFKKYIKVHGDVSESDHDRLIKIASSCPIHKLLVQTSEITTIIL